jgi:phosphoadenosine phosphosulfate reductase
MTALTSLSKDWKALSIELLNDLFMSMPFEKRIPMLYKYFEEQDVMVTSSFGTKSIFLLHLLHRFRPTQKVHFINTTYHFPETLAYQKQIEKLLGSTIIEVLPEEKENQLTREEQWWIDHPKMCCSINKVVPLEPVKAQHKVWISGLMSHQTAFRAGLRVFEKQGDIIKFHPNIDVHPHTFEAYLEEYDLPRHPLENEGYGSIGCTHCTAKGEGRNGRWKEKGKTQCRLHPRFFINKLKDKKADW